ncbi:O-methyltransferase ATR12 [Fulvia fulva]|uniref:O-methyltransferase ATR12 n=1 Tax=Passalora fulva TaxID=5499 RepID=A0A9Q8P731_PASFU|nr:O-methyltransferase ATR12 [Fulvia fulva]KAK4629377.1 O-methyltransferase ATR12 [Fulvia fulva]KAK4630768.1 O-methyltransferase ATR12 [Fulvia fulva]UJO15659.1 O-methyltransferase ATR12 [Fulvia fulva]WPV12567.1 O-methyltransferase ATR12 [Fulvia fulva]WPV27148.1 O-methyltransferase ATR12 [Fulvia fulva]
MEPPPQDTATLIQALQSITTTTYQNDPIAKSNLLRAVKALTERLEDPWERIYDAVFINPILLTTLKIATDITLWYHLDASAPQSYDVLASKTSTDPALLRRILRLLASSQVINEVDVETYCHSTYSAALEDPRGLVTGVQYYYHTPVLQHLRLPKYFAEQGYKHPTDPMTAPWKSMVGRPDYPGLRWQYLSEIDPEESLHFNTFLASMRKDQVPWPTLYPISDLIENYDPATPFLVDIGGGNGRDATQLAQHLSTHYPSLSTASIILQDQPNVLTSLPKDTLPPSIQPQPHDFFTPNPVRGARAYFLHSVLHDWPDDSALSILANIKCSMTEGYSKILLMERIMPARARDMDPRAAVLDIQMMCNFAALERTEAQWRDLVVRAGLRVVRVVGMGTYSMIEAEL